MHTHIYRLYSAVSVIGRPFFGSGGLLVWIPRLWSSVVLPDLTLIRFLVWVEGISTALVIHEESGKSLSVSLSRSFLPRDLQPLKGYRKLLLDHTCSRHKIAHLYSPFHLHKCKSLETIIHDTSCWFVIFRHSHFHIIKPLDEKQEQTIDLSSLYFIVHTLSHYPLMDNEGISN